MFPTGARDNVDKLIGALIVPSDTLHARIAGETLPLPNRIAWKRRISVRHWATPASAQGVAQLRRCSRSLGRAEGTPPDGQSRAGSAAITAIKQVSRLRRGTEQANDSRHVC